MKKNLRCEDFNQFVSYVRKMAKLGRIKLDVGKYSIVEVYEASDSKIKSDIDRWIHDGVIPQDKLEEKCVEIKTLTIKPRKDKVLIEAEEIGNIVDSIFV